MPLTSLTASRSISKRILQSQWNGSLGVYRNYSRSRDPKIAEEEAATVRGNRAARARLEEHRRGQDAGEQEYKEGKTFEGKTLSGEWCMAVLPAVVLPGFAHSI
jgi:hypothetical protein